MFVSRASCLSLCWRDFDSILPGSLYFWLFSHRGDVRQLPGEGVVFFWVCQEQFSHTECSEAVTWVTVGWSKGCVPSGTLQDPREQGACVRCEGHPSTGSKYRDVPFPPLQSFNPVVGFCRRWPVVKCCGRGPGGQRTFFLGLRSSSIHWDSLRRRVRWTAAGRRGRRGRRGADPVGARRKPGWDFRECGVCARHGRGLFASGWLCDGSVWWGTRCCVLGGPS